MESILKQFERIEMNFYSANVNISIGIDESPDLTMVLLFTDLSNIFFMKFFTRELINNIILEVSRGFIFKAK